MLRGLLRSSFVLFFEKKNSNRFKIRLILNTYSFSTFSVCSFNYFKNFVVLLIWQLITAAVFIFCFCNKKDVLYLKNFWETRIYVSLSCIMYLELTNFFFNKKF